MDGLYRQIGQYLPNVINVAVPGVSLVSVPTSLPATGEGLFEVLSPEFSPLGFSEVCLVFVGDFSGSAAYNLCLLFHNYKTSLFKNIYSYFHSINYMYTSISTAACVTFHKFVCQFS